MIYFSFAVYYVIVAYSLSRIFNSYNQKHMIDEKDIFKSLTRINEKVDSIVIILRGDEKLDTPSGLVYSVAENTKFRKFLQKIFWTIFLANTGLTAIIIFLLDKLYNTH